ncbi:MAG: hypothetical protein IH801_04710 [Nitrospinae bacterium]|nr:hypothetical protein [Nitrospinota bacterium]
MIKVGQTAPIVSERTRRVNSEIPGKSRKIATGALIRKFPEKRGKSRKIATGGFIRKIPEIPGKTWKKPEIATGAETIPEHGLWLNVDVDSFSLFI